MAINTYEKLLNGANVIDQNILKSKNKWKHFTMKLTIYIEVVASLQIGELKFRDHEKLPLFTGYGQSASERAASTLLYLLALQNLTRTLFRMVDEMDQGMEPRNERRIREQIIKSVSLSGTSYQSMDVLCIYIGEWQAQIFCTISGILQAFEIAD
ncbi:unnamed protein product [Absidia cylindrospora]